VGASIISDVKLIGEDDRQLGLTKFAQL
jgi:hypothetical protein